eukprot:7321450-Prymnesium_polylepis.1
MRRESVPERQCRPQLADGEPENASPNVRCAQAKNTDERAGQRWCTGMVRFVDQDEVPTSICDICIGLGGASRAWRTQQRPGEPMYRLTDRAVVCPRLAAVLKRWHRREHDNLSSRSFALALTLLLTQLHQVPISHH